MPRRTYENDAVNVLKADDLEIIVSDKRINWRSSHSKANQRQRRYKKRLTKYLTKINLDFED